MIKATMIGINTEVSRKCLIVLLHRLFHIDCAKKGKGDSKDLFAYGDLLTIFKALDATDEEILRLTKM